MHFRNIALPDIRLPVLVVLSMLSAQAFAASDCIVRYAYSAGSSTNPVHRESARTLSVGQTISINRSKIKWIHNRGSHPIKLYLTKRKLNGSMQNYTKTLREGKRTPPLAKFPGWRKLRTVSCLQTASTSTGIANRTASSLLNQLKRAGKSLDIIVQRLTTSFNLSKHRLAELLRGAGYTTEQVAGVLRRKAGATARETAAVLKTVFNSNLDTAGRILKGTGHSIRQIADALRQVYGASRAKTERVLRQLGYGARQIASVLDELYGATRQTARRAADGVGRLTRRGVDAAARVAARRMAIDAMFYGNRYSVGKLQNVIITNNVAVASDSFECDPLGNFNGDRLSAIGIPNNNRAIEVTLAGKGLYAATSISGLPAGVQARISRRGSCALRIIFRAPRSVRTGLQGRASLMVGNQRGASFSYSIGTLAQTSRQQWAANQSQNRRTGSPQSSRRVLDVRPAQIDVQLYRVAGSSPVTDNRNDIYTQLHRQSQGFCDGIATPVSPGQVTAVRRNIRLPEIVWGVENVSGSRSINTPFTITLYRGQQAIATERIANMSPRQVITFRYRRPISGTTVARLSDGNCYHAGRANEGWTDNPNLYVEVDSGNEILETREGVNNRRALGGL